MAELPQHFGHSNRHGVGQVQATNVRAAQWDPHGLALMAIEELLGQAVDFAAEEQAVAGLVGRFGVCALGARGKIEDPAFGREALAQPGEALVLDGWDPGDVREEMARLRRDRSILTAWARHVQPTDTCRWDLRPEMDFLD